MERYKHRHNHLATQLPVHLTLLSVKKVLCTIRGKLQDCDEHVFPQSEFIEA